MKTTLATLAILALWGIPTAFGQDPAEMPPPTKEHQWLNPFVGEWETENQASIPGQPPMQCKGTVSFRALGGFWVLGEYKMSMMDMTVEAVQTIGYDPQSKKYVGTWVDSMQAHQWQYQGTLDSSGKILTLEASGPNMLDPTKTAQFRDVYEIKSADLIAMSSAMLGDDGKWTTFSSGTLAKKKK